MWGQGIPLKPVFDCKFHLLGLYLAMAELSLLTSMIIRFISSSLPYAQP